MNSEARKVQGRTIRAQIFPMTISRSPYDVVDKFEFLRTSSTNPKEVPRSNPFRSSRIEVIFSTQKAGFSKIVRIGENLPFLNFISDSADATTP